MVYYRKYRPQEISELDLFDVREKLTSILSSKNLPHAFLFVGPRGLGKTSSARILAKAINCQDKKGIEPCNKCDICKSITEGSNIDIIEIDAASNRGVDEIRSLREKVKFSPSGLSKKVYIIDEVHMLTNEAFNALLKTLEEPPEHVVFILATTEVHKIPQTILSRVFSVKFESPNLEEISNSIKRIVDGEDIGIEKEVYEKIFELSEGSFRDGAKILEELMINSDGNKITMETVNKVYKSGSTSSQSEKLLGYIYKKDMKGALLSIEKISSEGIDFRIVIERMVGRLRTDLTSGKSELKVSDFKKILSLLNEAYSTTKFSVVPQLPLELVVMEWCITEDEKGSEIIKMDSYDKKQKPKENEQINNTEIKKPLGGESELLKELIDLVHKESRQVAAFLRSCKQAGINGPTLTLITPYSLHAEKLSKPEFREIILKSVFDLNPEIKDLEIKTS